MNGPIRPPSPEDASPEQVLRALLSDRSAAALSCRAMAGRAPGAVSSNCFFSSPERLNL
jgi:hypothetical protein